MSQSSEEPPTTSLLSPHPPSTGETLAVSPPSRTRDLADHAGPSHPLVLLRLPAASSSPTSSCSLSSSSLTAPLPTTTLDAVVDGTTGLMTTFPLETPRD